jgi:UDP-glucose 4-epimerase
VPKTHVVTGGAGFIGSHLCDYLIKRGDRVICVDNLVGTKGSSRNVDHLIGTERFRFVEEDILEWATPGRLDGVDTVFHQAASKMTVSLEDPERDLTVNALGTLRLLMSAGESGVRKFVLGSTGSVYGGLDAVQDERHPTRPLSVYGVSKLAGEQYARVVGALYNLDTTVLRYFHVIGSRQDDSPTGGVVPIFLRNCDEKINLTIFGSGEQVRSFTSVADVVAANVLVSENPAASNRVFNCASGIRVTIQELADYIISTSKAPVTADYGQERPGDIFNFNVVNTELVSLGMKFDTNWRAIVDKVRESRSGF